MAEEPKRGPVQSGSMYIAISQLRGQASTARWQHAVVFMLLNVPLTGLVKDLLAGPLQGRYVFLAMGVGALAAGLDWLWVGLVKRENFWIQFYTRKLGEMESQGTESGVLVFSADDFPSIARDSEGVSFRRGLWLLSWGATAMWVVVCISLFSMGVYLTGAGKL